MSTGEVQAEGVQGVAVTAPVRFGPSDAAIAPPGDARRGSPAHHPGLSSGLRRAYSCRDLQSRMVEVPVFVLSWYLGGTRPDTQLPLSSPGQGLRSFGPAAIERKRPFGSLWVFQRDRSLGPWPEPLPALARELFRLQEVRGYKLSGIGFKWGARCCRRFRRQSR